MKIKLALIILILLMMGSASLARAEDKAVSVKGKAVVFFGPTEQEYNSLSDNDKNEWSEILSDFYHYRDKTIPYLESNGIKSIITANSGITIQVGSNTRTYTRKKFKHIVGYILTDGTNEPKVIEGVGTDIDLINDFRKYFKIK